MTFVLGGFITSTARQVRQYIRPLVIPVPPPSNPNDKSKPPPPPQTLLKRVYDLAGTILTGLILNFASAPFLLLTARDSLTVWSRVNFYGLWVVFGGLVFFHAGGRAWLKSLQGQRMKKAGVQAPTTEKLPRDPHVALPPVDQAIREVQEEVGNLVQSFDKKTK